MLQPGLTVMSSTKDQTAEKAGLLFRVAKGLALRQSVERSFKVTGGRLFDNRFLIGISKNDIGTGADGRITEACSLLGMPEGLKGTLNRCIRRADHVHFGLEQNGTTLVYKVYLEFWEAVKRELETSGRAEPRLLHLGLKWDLFNPARHVVTHYTWHPRLSPQAVLGKSSPVLGPAASTAVREGVERLVSLALARAPVRDILCLEVTEEGNPRRSIDINVYGANLRVAETYSILSVLCRRHGIAFDTFHNLYNDIKTKMFGHLAAGTDREGKPFFTVYYGVEGTRSERAARPRPAPIKRAVSGKNEADRAGSLLRLVQDAGIKAIVERSFKFLDRLLLTDRFLLCFKRPVGEASRTDKAVLEVCRGMNMPEDYLHRFQAGMDEAKIILFGFEKNEKGCLYKAYLEFLGRLADVVNREPRPENVVTHEGYKWDPSDPSKKAATTYRAMPLFGAKEIAAHVSEHFYGASTAGLPAIVDDLVDLAGSRTRGGLLCLDVCEEGNPRSSFDINLYQADLQMAELYPLLLAVARHYSIGLHRFQEIYEAVKTRTLGHLSGGTDREGRDFLTVYFKEQRQWRVPGCTMKEKTKPSGRLKCRRGIGWS